MIRNYPENQYDLERVSKLNAATWQVELLKKNPDFVSWRPDENYMTTSDKGWSTSLIVDRWGDFIDDWTLGDMNECVNFYFFIDRDHHICPKCDGNRYNEETQILADSFYNPFQRWDNRITDDEVEALCKKGRLWQFMDNQYWFDDDSNQWWFWKDEEKVFCYRPIIPKAKEVNLKPQIHDEINRLILIETRAKRLGVWGFCDKCDGKGIIYDSPFAKLGLTLWMIQPKRGASRGVRINEILEHQINDVLDFLREAKKRNDQRFSID